MKVGIVMGSISDWDTMRFAAAVLENLGIEYEKAVVSAHRTPERLKEYTDYAERRDFEAIIAGAGGAAHLPGMLASFTILPVIGVPIMSAALNGVDSLLSIAQMPSDIPVATMAIGVAGAKNAAVYAARQIARKDEGMKSKLLNHRYGLGKVVDEQNKRLAEHGPQIELLKGK